MTGGTGRDGSPIGVKVASVVALALGFCTMATSGLAAQQLPIKTAPLPGAVVICGSTGGGVTSPIVGTTTDSAEVVRLADAATQAMILGDLAAALDFLDQALLLDPGAAEAIYLRARILEEQGEVNAAAAALCAYLALRPDGPSAREVHQRLDEARDAGIGQEVAARYRQALALEFEGRLEEAEAAFSDVLSARPDAPMALYNRGVVRSVLGRSEGAQQDFERYVRLTPAPADVGDVRRYLVATFPASEEATRAAQAGPAGMAGPRPGTAFAVGALLPGGGQFYTGRPALGLAVTALAGGALATGLLYERTTVRCLDATIQTNCPEELVASRETSRPFLAPAVLAAAGVMIGAAIEASFHASRRSAERDAAGGDGSARLGFSGDVRYDGASLHVGLIRLRF